MTPRVYPYERLRLACGCYEVATAPGAAGVWICKVHTRPASFMQEDNGTEALARARHAISELGILTVQYGAGIARLDLDHPYRSGID